MSTPKLKDFVDLLSYEAFVAELYNAAKPFAEKPTEYMDSYPCHAGITTKEKCGRCSRATRVYAALQFIETLGLEG